MRIEKITTLKNGNLLFAYWANNKNRGTNNCTLVVVPAGTARSYCSGAVKNAIAKTRCSSWAGNVNLSKSVLEKIGLQKEDLLP